MTRFALFSVALAAGLVIPAMGSLCSPADAYVSVSVQSPTIVINTQPTVVTPQPTYQQPVVVYRPAPVQRVERVRYVEVPVRERTVVYERVEYHGKHKGWSKGHGHSHH